jgi:oxepin-CoA hydrolase/3-oxo-5,6-dehydrosuberyl-CoA semialdehyde dehydrogenase
MEKLKNYIYGQWVEGNGNGVPLYNAVTGEQVAVSDTEGLNLNRL